MSKELTAVTAFDAFCQAIESFWSVGATDESKKYAAESIETLTAVFKDVIDHPDKECRDIMMKAAFLAGKAINISKTTGPHALSYALTQGFRIPHGLAVILTLPAFMDFNTSLTKDLNNKLTPDEYGERVNELFKILKVSNTVEAINTIHKMIAYTGFQVGLRNYGVSVNDIKPLAESVNVERLGNNPTVLSHNDVQLIYKQSL